MSEEMKNAINATDMEAQYDENAKRLLSHKIILAHILLKTIAEFQGMTPEEIIPYIEGEPFISMVPVEPGMTNMRYDEKGQRLVGMNTEYAEVNEGLVRFDIIFYVRMPKTDSRKKRVSQVIINLEAQKDEPTNYHILNRAVFYVSRLISSQKERDFVNSNYNDIKQVFSIWVCMNMTENSMNHVHLTDDKILGNYHWKGKMDLLNIVLIGIANELPEYSDKFALHRLLITLLSMELSVEEKLRIIETEYGISVSGRIGEEVGEMCNLSQGILEKGEIRGEARGEAKAEARFIFSMYEKGYTIEQIADVVEKTIEEIRAVITKRNKIPV